MGLTLVREDRVGRTSSVRVIPPGVVLGSYVRKGETLKASKRETFHKMSLLLRVVKDYDVDRLQV